MAAAANVAVAMIADVVMAPFVATSADDVATIGSSLLLLLLPLLLLL
jgi:hypothetical protein